MQKKVFEVEFGGMTLTAEFNNLASQAHGSVILHYGETAILVTAIMGRENPSLPYFPLSVEFEEKFYAAGQILGSRFIRREGRPSDEAVLSARIVDRTIRPPRRACSHWSISRSLDLTHSVGWACGCCKNREE